MAQHVKILGILHIVLGAMGVLAAIIVLMIFGGFRPWSACRIMRLRPAGRSRSGRDWRRWCSS